MQCNSGQSMPGCIPVLGTPDYIRSILKGKEAPTKNLRGQGPLGEGLGGGVSAQMFYVYVLFWCLNMKNNF